MANQTIQIIDDKEAYRKIISIVDGLDNIDREQAIQSGLRQGGNIFKKAALSELKARNTTVTGNLARSVAVQVFKKKKKVHTGFKRHKKYKGTDVGGGNHAHLVDLGTKIRKTKKPYTVVYKSGRVQHFKAGLNRGKMYAGKSKTKWAGKYYSPHGKAGFYTAAKEKSQAKAMNAVINGVDKAVKKIMSRNI